MGFTGTDSEKESDEKTSSLQEEIDALKSRDGKQQAAIGFLKRKLLRQKSNILEKIQQFKQSSYRMNDATIADSAPALKSLIQDLSEISMDEQLDNVDMDESRYSGPAGRSHEDISLLRITISHLTKDNARKTMEISSIRNENSRLRADARNLIDNQDALLSEVGNLNSKVRTLVEEVGVSKKRLDECSYYYYSQRKEFQSVMKSMWGTMNSLQLERDRCKDEVQSYMSMTNTFVSPFNNQKVSDISKSDAVISVLKSLDESDAIDVIVKFVANPRAENLVERLCDDAREKLQLQPCVPNDRYESLMSTSNEMRMKLDGLKGQLANSEKSKGLLKAEISTLKSRVLVMGEEKISLQAGLKSAEVMSRLLREDLEIMKEFRLKAMNRKFPFIPTAADAQDTNLHQCFIRLQNELKFFEDMERDLLGVSTFLDLDSSQQETLIKSHPYVLDEIGKRNIVGGSTDFAQSAQIVNDATTGPASGKAVLNSTDNPLAIMSMDAPSESEGVSSHDAVVSMDSPIVQSDAFAELAAAVSKSTQMLSSNPIASAMCLPYLISIQQLLTKATEQSNEYAQRLDECQSYINALRSEKASIEAAVATLRVSLATQKALVGTLQSQINDLRSAHAADTAQWAAVKAGLEASIKLKDQQLAAATNDIERLKTVISNLEVDKMTLGSSLQTCNNKVSVRDKQISELNNVVKARDREIETLSQQNSQLSLETIRLHNSLVVCTNETTNLQNQADTQSLDLRQCQAELGDCSVVENSCAHNLKTCLKSNEKFENELVTVTSQYADLETKFSDMRRSIDSINRQFSDLRAQVESGVADLNAITAAKEQLVSLLLQYQANITVIDGNYNQLILGELTLMNTSLHQCESDILSLQTNLSSSAAQLVQQRIDCQRRIENITTQLSGDCGEKENFLTTRLENLYDTRDRMQAAMDRALLLSEAATASIVLLSATASFKIQIAPSSIREQNITRHLLQFYENAASLNVTPETAAGHFIIEHADSIFATPSSGKAA